jgi:hypothetical protein
MSSLRGGSVFEMLWRGDSTRSRRPGRNPPPAGAGGSQRSQSGVWGPSGFSARRARQVDETMTVAIRHIDSATEGHCGKPVPVMGPRFSATPCPAETWHKGPTTATDSKNPTLDVLMNHSGGDLLFNLWVSNLGGGGPPTAAHPASGTACASHALGPSIRFVRRPNHSGRRQYRSVLSNRCGRQTQAIAASLPGRLKLRRVR